MKRVLFRILLGVSLAGTSFAASPAPASACAMEYITPTTFRVQFGKFDKTYEKLDKVKVHVTVTRPAAEDPAGLGIGFDPPVSQPAAEVNVGVGISVGRVFLPGYGFTDENGRATVSIRLERYTPTKSAYVRAFAYRTTLETTCLTVEEQGFATAPNAFTVKG